MGLFAKLLSKFQDFEESHPNVKFAAEVGAAVASHLHGGGTLSNVITALRVIADEVEQHHAEKQAQAAGAE